MKKNYLVFLIKKSFSEINGIIISDMNKPCVSIPVGKSVVVIMVNMGTIEDEVISKKFVFLKLK